MIQNEISELLIKKIFLIIWDVLFSNHPNVIVHQFCNHISFYFCILTICHHHHHPHPLPLSSLPPPPPSPLMIMISNKLSLVSVSQPELKFNTDIDKSIVHRRDKYHVENDKFLLSLWWFLSPQTTSAPIPTIYSPFSMNLAVEVWRLGWVTIIRITSLW